MVDSLLTSFFSLIKLLTAYLAIIYGLYLVSGGLGPVGRFSRHLSWRFSFPGLRFPMMQACLSRGIVLVKFLSSGLPRVDLTRRSSKIFSTSLFRA